jgi:hypothetical protein
MWFPSKNKVAAKVDELIEQFERLHERTMAWHGQLREGVLAGVSDGGLLEWMEGSRQAQESLLEMLRMAQAELSDNTAEWRGLLPFVTECTRTVGKASAVLDRLDRDKQSAETRMKAVWRSHGVLDE